MNIKVLVVVFISLMIPYVNAEELEPVRDCPAMIATYRANVESLLEVVATLVELNPEVPLDTIAKMQGHDSFEESVISSMELGSEVMEVLCNSDKPY